MEERCEVEIVSKAMALRSTRGPDIEQLRLIAKVGGMAVTEYVASRVMGLGNYHYLPRYLGR